jgi:hypothetical protein
MAAKGRINRDADSTSVFHGPVSWDSDFRTLVLGWSRVGDVGREGYCGPMALILGELLRGTTSQHGPAICCRLSQLESRELATNMPPARSSWRTREPWPSQIRLS